MKRLADTLHDRFSRRDELSRQLQIVKVFDLYKVAVRRMFGSLIGRPKSLKYSTLYVETTSADAASELRLREPEILDAVNGPFRNAVVSKIIYRF